MASPQYTPAAAPGNLIASATALAAGAGFGAYLDASTVFEAQVTCKMQTGTATPSTPAGVQWSAYHVVGATTITVAASAGTSVTLSIANTAGMQVGQAIAVENELATITAISGNNVAVGALLRSHSSGAPVYLVEQSPSARTLPGPTNGSTYAGSTVYSKTLYLSTSRYFVAAANLDTANAVTIEATVDQITGVA